MTNGSSIEEKIKEAFARFKQKDFQKTDAPTTLIWLGRGDVCRQRLDELGHTGGAVTLELRKGRIGHVIDTGGVIITKPDEEILSIFNKFGITAVIELRRSATDGNLRAAYRATPPEVTSSGLEQLPSLIKQLQEFGEIARIVLIGIEWQEKDRDRMEKLAAKLASHTKIPVLSVDFTPDRLWTARSYSFLIRGDKYTVMVGTLRGRSHYVESGSLTGKPRSFLENLMSLIRR